MAQVTLDQVIAQYLAPMTPSTRSSYKSTINSWLRWCDLNQLDPLKATASHIEVYGRYLRAQLGRSSHYQSTSLSIISNLYRQAHHAGLVPEDPGPYVRRPKVPSHSTGTSLDRDQARRLLQAAKQDLDPRLDALTRLLLLNGCRLREAINLDITDHHPGDHPWIQVLRKGGWEQRLGITPDTSKAIARITSGRTQGPVFTRGDQRLPIGAARRLIIKLARHAGLDGITPHSLRRTFATLSREAGVPDPDIIAAAGWVDDTMLNYYDMHHHAIQGKATNTLSQYLA
ncbi:tyrosine-type recombinase/integrase [uncultured Bifidobacterium sp.]|uniref:tyrosine-type recombinase/integrase n=1 Tax=uncultured Bifidobacterium sp. TaxID=165187 RepID=UPI0025D7926E|nr:tyrosine-type recombinase/integrase [uncultured Bifidobacterium sp.]